MLALEEVPLKSSKRGIKVRGMILFS